MNGSVSREITVFYDGAFHKEARELVEEIGYRIIVNQRKAGRLSCSPWNVREAVLGALYMQGTIRNADDILSLEICDKAGEICVLTRETEQITKDFGKVPMQISAAEVMRLSEMLEERSQLFRRTGGVHCAALARAGEFLAYEEDVSRHAAVDKLVGSCIHRNIPMNGAILVFSGRVPGEIVHKAAVMECAAIIARSAPTDYACRIAAEKGITLIGFARDDSFNIYSYPEQISL